jgi:tetratricopeptide (TPR) repeat protein
MARISFTRAKLNTPPVNNSGEEVSADKELNTEENVKKKRIGFTNMQLGQLPVEQVTNKRVDDKKKKSSIELKDSILFKTDIEYEEYLYQTLEVNGLFPELYEHFKIFLMSKNDVVGLEKIWKYADDLALETCELLLEKADVLRQISRMDLVLVYLEQASRKFPENAKVNYGMSMYYKLERNYELAIHWMQKWLAVDGSNPEVYYQMGSTYKRIGMVDLAAQRLRECLALDSSHIAAKSLLDKIL